MTAAGAPAAAISVDDGRITAVGAAPTVTRRRLRPGLVDLQVNGFGDDDLTTAPGALWSVACGLVAEGVTSFLPTLVSPSAAIVRTAVDVLEAGPPSGWVGARPLGWHLEGPYVSSTRAGAHPPAAIRPVDLAEVAAWRTPAVRLVTLAPEVDGALEAVELLRDNGIVVAAGHSEATAEQARAGFRAGVGVVTHLFNAMSPLHHRAPGLPGAALADDRAWLTVVADGTHLDETTLRVIARAAGDRVVLVSDRVAAGTSGRHGRLAGRDLVRRDGAARTSDGALAGAAVGLLEGVRTWRAATGVDDDAAWAAASTRPAAVLGIEQAAGVAVGAPADLVEFDEDGQVCRTIVGGVVAHER